MEGGSFVFGAGSRRNPYALIKKIDLRMEAFMLTCMVSLPVFHPSILS